MDAIQRPELRDGTPSELNATVKSPNIVQKTLSITLAKFVAGPMTYLLPMGRVGFSSIRVGYHWLMNAALKGQRNQSCRTKPSLWRGF